MTDYDAVLFDNDGVLVEPPARATQAAATREAFRAVGVEDPEEAHVAAVVDGVTRDELGEICRAYDLAPERFWAAREDHDERSQFAAFRRGDRDRYEDVEAIATLDVPTGVVSNNHHTTVEWILDAFDMDGWFETVVGRPKTVESVGLKKPNPHYLQRALDDLGVDSALYVGDSRSDLLAADRAGIDAAFVRRPHCRDLALSSEPTVEVDGLDALDGVLD